MTGRVHSYETFGAVDGPGIRFIVFLQGCPMRCLYCHNPDTWDPSGGTEATVDEIVAKVRSYRGFYRDGGVTISGGEPLLQHEFVYALTEALHAEGFHVAIDTSGIIPLDICKKAVDAADMLLLDIKSANAELAGRITGAPECFRREKELLDYCAGQVAAYAKPRELEFRTELPKTLVGKVAYRVLEEEANQEAK